MFAIRCRGVGKHFRIPLDRSATLKYRVTHLRSASRFRELRALHDVSFDVKPGEFLGIIGHNGSGKSTLLKVLSRIYRADTGMVEINGNVSPFLELGVGFNPELTARENIYLNGAVLGLTRRDLDKRIEHIIAFAELEQFTEQKLKNFSTGMQLRLAFSVAIQADAEVLLMDEVLAVGDARFQEKCFDTFARYKREGRTIVLVTHDLGSVTAYCDRALLLAHGELIADESPTAAVGRYRRMVSSAPDDDVAVGALQPNRWGSREVEITAVRLLDDQNRVSRVFATGSRLSVEIDYAVNSDDVGDFVSSLSVQRTDGVQLAHSASSSEGVRIACPPVGSRGTITYAIEALPLLGASYTITVALTDRYGTQPFDRIENAVSLRVVDERGRSGLVELGGRWIVGTPTIPANPEGTMSGTLLS